VERRYTEEKDSKNDIDKRGATEGEGVDQHTNA
jgi:hypothetical protein